MIMETASQIISKISEAHNVLILVAGNNSDSLASGLALHSFLRKVDKEATTLSVMPKTPRLSFLSGFTDVAEQIELKKNFVIDVSTQRTEIEELSYKKETDRLSIFIKPKKGQFQASDITFRNSSYPFELLILIGIDSLEQLGDFYSQNAELFFETPILNIGYRASNESYGSLNLVNLSATSHSEIIFDLIAQYESSLIDENIATQLLTGIISETESFQHVRTTPQTFLKASQLVSLGANQQQIISQLYKNKSLGMLKLWGRTLARLKQETGIGLAYSVITGSDLAKSAATEEDADGIIKEMATQLGFARAFLFLKEEAPAKTVGYFQTSLPLAPHVLLAGYNPKLISQQAVKFTMELPLYQAENQVISFLKQTLPNY